MPDNLFARKKKRPVFGPRKEFPDPQPASKQMQQQARAMNKAQARKADPLAQLKTTPVQKKRRAEHSAASLQAVEDALQELEKEMGSSRALPLVGGSSFAKIHRELTAYKKPKYIEFRDELPKTNVGKILRRQLRDEKKAA